ncbi:hypothetical protein BpHYR1_009463 [Brachionus plicatilis]|uniref:Uncharacterized protein n=1 Tax=Brachionus plicatilis TaxID=10195 RepID=A0A3M7PQZ4_BRAPC|nr:hypothetical protein BpHYR1_009463 [Brachionus plicatilis]
MRNKIIDYLKSQSNMLQVPVEKLATKFRPDQKVVGEQAARPSPSKSRAQNSPGLSPRSTNRPLLKLAVKLNSPKPNAEEKKEPEAKENGPESKKCRSESRSPVSSRSSSPSKVSSDSECKVSENGSISPVSQSQESRSNSPSRPLSPKEKPVQTPKQKEPEQKHKPEDSLQPIQPVYSHQYIPPQQFYPYNMPTGQMYPQMEPYFNSRFPRPNFAMQPPQTMFNSNMMRYPAPGALPAQNFYQMYPGGHQGFMSEQFYANRPHALFQNGYQYQNFQRNSKMVRRRSRSRSRSRRSPDRPRRKRSYSRSRSRSPRRHRRNSRHRSRSRSGSRRDKRASYRRKSSSRKRDKSRSRSRDRQKKQSDNEKPQRIAKIEETKGKPLNKENEMDQREKTIHKLNNLMHRKSNVEAKSYANGAAAVTLAANQINESQQGEKDAKKNQIIILLKTNSKQNERSDEKKAGEDAQVGSPVKKSTVKRKVHLKKELATTSTVKKIMLEKCSIEKKCSESEDKSEDFLDIAIDEKINL